MIKILDFVGGIYDHVVSSDEDGVTVIKECRLIGVSIVPTEFVADETLKIRRKGVNEVHD